MTFLEKKEKSTYNFLFALAWMKKEELEIILSEVDDIEEENLDYLIRDNKENNNLLTKLAFKILKDQQPS